MNQQRAESDPRAEGLRVAADRALAAGPADLVPLTVVELCAAAGASTASFYTEFGSVTEFRKEVAARLLDQRILAVWADDVPVWRDIDLDHWPQVIHDLAASLDGVRSTVFLRSWMWIADPAMRETVWERCEKRGHDEAPMVALARECFGWHIRIDDWLLPAIIRHIRDADMVATDAYATVTWTDEDNVERTTGMLGLLTRGVTEILRYEPEEEPYEQQPPRNQTLGPLHSEAALDEGRERFFQVVLDEMSPEPFSNQTVWQIASRAGMSPSTLAHHFEDNTDLHQQIYAEVVGRLGVEASDESLGKLEYVLLDSRGAPNRTEQIIATIANEVTRKLAEDPAFNYYVASSAMTDVDCIQRQRRITTERLRSSLGDAVRLALSGTELDPAAIDRDAFDDAVFVAILAGAMHRHLGEGQDLLQTNVAGVTMELAGVALLGTLKLLVGSPTAVKGSSVRREPVRDVDLRSVHQIGMAGAAAIAFEHGPSDIVPLSVAEVCKAAGTGASSFYRVFKTGEQFRVEATIALVKARIAQLDRHRGWPKRAPLTPMIAWPDTIHYMIGNMRRTLRREPFLQTWSWIARPEVLATVKFEIGERSQANAAGFVNFFEKSGRAITIDPSLLNHTLRLVNDVDVLLGKPWQTVEWSDTDDGAFQTSLHHLLFWSLTGAFTVPKPLHSELHEDDRG